MNIPIRQYTARNASWTASTVPVQAVFFCTLIEQYAEISQKSIQMRWAYCGIVVFTILPPDAI